MEQPKMEVTTKYGTLTLTFTDPNADGSHDSRGYARTESDKHVASLSGELVINRIPIRVSTRVVYATEHYEAGKELATPVRVMREDYRSSYNRRSDVSFGGELTPGARDVLRKVIAGPVRDAYESAPELQRAARRYHLAYSLERLEAKHAEAQLAARNAGICVLAARDALDAFDAGEA